MPRTRYEEAQFTLAKLLICHHYELKPEAFVFIIKEIVLKEAYIALHCGEANLNGFLLRENLAAQLFKFGILCYDKESYLTYFTRQTKPEEFDFLEQGHPTNLKSIFQEQIQITYDFYSQQTRREELIATFKGTILSLPDQPMKTPSRTLYYEPSRSPTSPKSARHGSLLFKLRADLEADLKGAYDFMATSLESQLAINNGTAAEAIFGGLKHTLIKAIQSQDEKTTLLQHKHSCCSML